MLNSSIKSILREIDKAIEACDSTHTPTLCAMRADNRDNLVARIYNLVVMKGIFISEAMAELEQSFSLNSPE